MGYVYEDYFEDEPFLGENPPMDRKPSMPFLTGTSYFIEELKKRTFKSGEAILKVMNPYELSAHYLFENGFSTPIVLHSSEGLDLRVPPVYNWSDLEEYIGPETTVEVIDVEKQDPTDIEFATFIKYMKKPKRHKILNLISMECSNNRLGSMIEPPRVARDLDWVRKYWPDVEKVERPRVQKYCLISPKNSYTDFHIDFGGTSVWYHLVRGEKVFYIIRPSEANSSLFWNWTESTNRLQTFFADQVDECFKCTLTAGNTLFLPTGWIHAVLTTEDSLVYGGNFLHSLNIEEQLAIYSMETKTRTPCRYMFPHFEDLHWLAGHELLKELENLNLKHITAPKYLLVGLKAILVHLRHWLPNERMFYLDPNETNFFLKELSKQIRYAERLIQMLNPPKPERESTRTRKRPVHEDFVDFSFYRKKSPKKSVDDSSPSTKDKALIKKELDNVNWHVYNGGLKVVLRKFGGNADYPSTSSGLRPEFIEEKPDIFSSGFHQLMKRKNSNSGVVGYNDDEDEEEDENALKIVEFSEVEVSGSPNNHSPKGLFGFTSDSANKNVVKRNSQLLYSIPTYSTQTIGTPEHRNFSDDSESFQLSTYTLSGNPFSLTESSSFSQQANKTKTPRPKKEHKSGEIYRDEPKSASHVVHQDDDYVYPSLELTDEENDESLSAQEKDDEPWSPKAKVGIVEPRTDRPSRVGKTKIAVEKGLEAAAANEHPTPKLPKVIKKKKIKPVKAPAPLVKPVVSGSTPSSSKTCVKPKKGLATAKQRLGKILKLHKMRR